MPSCGLRVSVAGIVVEINSPDPMWHELLSQRYYLFLTDAAPDWVVSLLVEPDLERADPPWARHDEILTTFYVGYSKGTIDLPARTAQVAAPAAVYGPSSADRVLSFILTYDLPRAYNSMLLHGVAVVRNGVGLALTGRSGAGKTTVARLAAGSAQVLTDENLVISLAGGQPELVSTPFWGASTPPEMIERINRHAPLRAIVLLEHGPEFSLVPLSEGDAIMALLTTEKVAVERVSSAHAWLAMAQRIVNETPTFRLYSRPTRELWPFLDKELGL